MKYTKMFHPRAPLGVIFTFNYTTFNLTPLYSTHKSNCGVPYMTLYHWHLTSFAHLKCVLMDVGLFDASVFSDSFRAQFDAHDD